MRRLVAFLRAINVGGHTVKMDRLRGLFESLGYANVETFIASGNVIFETTATAGAKLEKRISERLEEDLGYGVETFVRTIAETAAIENRCPYAPKKRDDSVYIAFLHQPLNAAARSALEAVKNKMNDFAMPGREIYWLRRNRDDSIFLKNPLEKIIGVPTTVRNLSTIHKLLEKFG